MVGQPICGEGGGIGSCGFTAIDQKVGYGKAFGLGGRAPVEGCGASMASVC